jgi:hypothetical protein
MHVYNILVWKPYWKRTPTGVVLNEKVLNRSKEQAVRIWTVVTIMREISGGLLPAVIKLTIP